MYGLGTVINVVAILWVRASEYCSATDCLNETRVTVTDALGLVTLVIGGLNVVALQDQAFVDAVGRGIPLLIVIGALLFGGITGSLLQIERRLEALGGWLQRRLAAGEPSRERARFVEGFVDSSLVFCIGPLAVLGALSDGLGQGIDELTLKATLDGFASIAFAASLGWGWRLLPCRSGSGRDCSRCWQFCWDPSCPMLWSRCHGHRRVLLLGSGYGCSTSRRYRSATCCRPDSGAGAHRQGSWR